MELPRKIYFVGAGGIGMAALVRYALAKGIKVAGYDRTATPLTRSLCEDGASITYTDDVNQIPDEFRDKATTLVVRTPAVPESNAILSYFRCGGFDIVKRAALLGRLTDPSKAICVAGSHGKTTTSSMIAHILNGSKVGCTAFLGGILRNCGSNLILSAESPYTVVEADEYDRSFHHLSPTIAIITSTDPDHLDIYGNEENYLESFAHFTELIRPGGYLIEHTELKLKSRPGSEVKRFTYSATSGGDFHADSIRYEPGRLFFDFIGPNLEINDIELGVPVEINVDNAVAAAAASHLAGATAQEIKEGLRTFKGAKRRFEIHLRGDEPNGTGTVLIDDYAHSPAEVRASINSVKKLYPGKKLTVIFQPHLYSRTRDFAPEFAQALSEAHSVLLTEIYPARELPIEGVNSELIFKDIKGAEKTLCKRKDLLNIIKNTNFDILMTLGAADLDTLLPDIKNILTQQ